MHAGCAGHRKHVVDQLRRSNTRRNVLRPSARRIAALVECDDAITLIGKQFDQRIPHQRRLGEPMQHHDAGTGIVQTGDACAKLHGVCCDSHDAVARFRHRATAARRSRAAWRCFQSNDNRLPPTSTAIRITATDDQQDDEGSQQSHAGRSEDWRSALSLTSLVSRGGCADTAKKGGGDHAIQSACDRSRRHVAGRRKNSGGQHHRRARGARCGIADHHRDRALASDGTTRRKRTRHRRTLDRVFRRAGTSAGG